MPRPENSGNKKITHFLKTKTIDTLGLGSFFQRSFDSTPDLSKESFMARADRFLGWVCFAGIVVLAFLLIFHTLADTDIFLHLRAGEVIFSARRIPHQDIFSFTMNGKPWIDAQWLFQLIIFSLYKLWGYAGMIIFGAVLSGLTWALILKTAFNPKRYFFVILLCFLSLLASSMRMNLRPETLSYFFLAAEIFAIHEYRRGKIFYAFALPFLLLLWVNSQGIWPIYFVVLSVFVFEEMVFLPGLKVGRYLARPASYAGRSSAAGLLIALLFSAPAAFLNPYGLRGVKFPLKLLYDISSGAVIKSLIIELQSPFASKFPMIDRIPFIALLALSSAIIILSILRRRIYLSTFVLWAIFLLLSLQAIRNVPLFAMISASLVGAILAENAGKDIFPSLNLKARLEKLRPYGAAAMLLIMVLLAGDVATSKFFIQNRWYSRFGTGALETDYPIRAGERLKLFLAGKQGSQTIKIFADFQNADYFMWSGYPSWKLYFDTRLDQLYPEELLRAYIQAFKSWKVFENEDSKYDFDVVILCSIFERKDFILDLFHSPDWALIYVDGFSVVFLKNKPEFAEAIAKYRIDFQKASDSPLPRDLSGLWLSRERLYRGYIILALGHPELAVPEFMEGIKLDPIDPNLNFYLGSALNQLSRPGDAKIYLEKAAKESPDSAKIQIQLARSLAMLSQTDRAISIFKTVLEKHPEEIIACMDLARVYEMTGSGSALDQWQKCRKIYDSNPQAFQAQADEISQAINRLGKK